MIYFTTDAEGLQASGKGDASVLRGLTFPTEAWYNKLFADVVEWQTPGT